MNDATIAPDPPAASATQPLRGGGTLAGTGALIRLVLRRDRIRIPVWLVAVVGFVTVSAASVPDVYPTAAERQERGDFVRNPVLTIFSGPGYGADDYTVGAMVANEFLIYGVVALALMSSLLVIRHTRAEEEAGRAELVRAAVVGPRAAPTAALIVAVVVNLLVGATTALALDASLEELSTVGSWAFGLSMASAGIVFAAAAAVAAQVTQHARGATGLALVTLAVAFALRAAGDIGDRTLSWLSPIGWSQATRAYVDERWWPLALSALFAFLLTGVAYMLVGRRDLGAGFVAPRPGPQGASRWLGRPVGLAVRLHRAGLVAWGLGLTALGVVFGSLVGEVEVFLAENPQLQEFFGASEGDALVEAFLRTVLVLLSLLAAGYAVTAALWLPGEEGAGRAEPVLATAVTRVRWAGSHLAVALAGAAVVVLCAAAGAGVAAAIAHGRAGWMVDMVGAGLAYVPAVWLVVAVVMALYGLAARAAAWGWLVLVYAAVVGLMGDLLDLPDEARVLSPFHHVADLPGGDVGPAPIVTLALTAILVAIGLAAFRRRDVGTT